MANDSDNKSSKLHPSDALMKVPSFGPLEEADCSLCGSEACSPLVVQHWFAEDFVVVRCDSCGMIRTNPRPTSEWKTRFYDPAFNGLSEKMGREFIYAPEPDRLPSYRRLLRLIMSRVSPGSRLLDVGAASCVFTGMAHDAGFDAVACDYSDDALAYGREHYQVPTIQSPAENIDTEDASFDVVTIFHTIEHLPDPLAVLKELHRILKPGGMIFIETPNYLPHSLIQTKFQFLWPIYKLLTKREHGLPWVPFDHYYHWTPRHIRKALQQVGFEEARPEHILGYRSNTKPNLVFWVAYVGYDCLAQLIHWFTLGRWDLRLVLLASGRKAS